MRPAKRTSAPEGTEILFVAYIPNLETLGAVWRKDDVLHYDQNHFAVNDLPNELRSWSKRWGLKVDSPEFFNRLQSGDGWRWEITSAVA